MSYEEIITLFKRGFNIKYIVDWEYRINKKVDKSFKREKAYAIVYECLLNYWKAIYDTAL